MDSLSFLPRHAIDDVAYDRCLANAPRRLVYAAAWYLDAVSPGWAALVEGNYQRVMPVPLRYRYGIKSVMQPLFCHQLGIFGAPSADDTSGRFIRALQRRVKYAPAYPFCAGQTPMGGNTFWSARTNHVLDLRPSYESVAAAYSADRRANLRRGRRAGWKIEPTRDVDPIIALFRTYQAPAMGRVAPQAYAVLHRLVRILLERDQVQLRVARKNGRIEAGCLLVTDTDRVIHLFCAASPEGRRGNARTVILDQFIREYAGNNRLFDFESPEIESIAAFNRSFGAVPEVYGHLGYNLLPQFLQRCHWVKKHIHRFLLKR